MNITLQNTSHLAKWLRHLTEGELRVIVSHQAHADNLSGFSYKDRATIAEETGLHAGSVSRALTSLRERGWLKNAKDDSGRKGRRLIIPKYTGRPRRKRTRAAPAQLKNHSSATLEESRQRNIKVTPAQSESSAGAKSPIPPNKVDLLSICSSSLSSSSEGPVSRALAAVCWDGRRLAPSVVRETALRFPDALAAVEDLIRDTRARGGGMGLLTTRLREDLPAMARERNHPDSGEGERPDFSFNPVEPNAEQLAALQEVA